VTAPNQTNFPPLTDHAYAGPFLTVGALSVRCAALLRHARQIESELGFDHPQVALARSWYAISCGAEFFDEKLLQTLRETEPVIREFFPGAHRALAMNLAAQGCHAWFALSRHEAIGPLASALHLMLTHDVAVGADVAKVAELLADCYADAGDVDDALVVLHIVQPYMLGAHEKEESELAQDEQVLERLFDENGDDCSAARMAAAPSAR